MEIGDRVTFVNPVGAEFEAIVTAVWGLPDDNPSVNVVYVSADETKQDQYGRQIERSTSVVHESRQGAHGNYWR